MAISIYRFEFWLMIDHGMSEKISILMLIPYKNCFFPPFNFMKWAKIFFFSFLTKEKSMTYVEWSSHYSRINLQLIFEPFLQIGQWHLQMTKRKIPRNKTAKKIHPFLFHNRVKLKSIWIPFHGKRNYVHLNIWALIRFVIYFFYLSWCRFESRFIRIASHE